MRTFAAGLFAAGLVALCGCGKSGYVTVRGVVLLDGEPVPEASVAFVPEDPHGEGATGYTDEDGRFVMKSTIRRRGEARQVQGANRGAGREAAADQGHVPDHGREARQGWRTARATPRTPVRRTSSNSKESAAAAKKKRLATPPIYNDIDKTPLRADVPAQTEYKFELTKDGK